MKKTITIPQNMQSFTIPAPFPLVAGDVNAYEVVLPLPEAADGAQFTVQAKRANNQVVTDTVQISGAEARYTLKSNMYDIAGSLFLRLQVVQDGSILSECQLDCEVLEAYGSDVTADDRLPALSSAIVQTQEATAAASTAAQAANEAAEAANAAAQEAEGVAGRVTALENNTTLIQNSGGGFAAGTDSEAGQGAAVGYGASADNGGAAGRKAFATSGGAVGYLAAATKGGAAGQSAVTDIGGAVGANAKAGAGFAGGSDAKAVDSDDNGIDAIQLGTGTNSTPKTLQVYGHQLMDANGYIPKERLREEDGGFAAGEGSSAGAGGAIGDSASATTGGAAGENAETSTGFAGGAGAESVTGGAVGAGANVTTGGAAGSGAFTTTGGAVGTESSSTAGGGAIGGNTWTTAGGAVGNNARADYGGAVGSNANASYGGAVGANSKANNGGAIGNNAVSGDGFAGGSGAKAVDSSNNGINAIQLGTGTNSTPGTMQVYSYQLLDEEGKIPDARLNDAPSDGNTYARKDGAWSAISLGGGLPTLSWDEMDDFEKGVAIVTRIEDTTNVGEGTRYDSVCLLIAGKFCIIYNGAQDGNWQSRQTLIHPDGRVMTRVTSYSGGAWGEWKEYIPSAS